MLFEKSITAHFKDKYNVIKAFSFKFDMLGLSHNYTIFVLHRGIVIEDTFIHYPEEKTLNEQEILAAIDNSLFHKITKLDALLFNKVSNPSSNKQKSFSSKQDYELFHKSISDLDWALHILGIKESTFEGLSLDIYALKLLKAFEGRRENPLLAYQYIQEVLVISNDQLIDLLKQEHTLPSDILL